MRRRAKSTFYANACPYCGSTILYGYKGKEGMAKCVSTICHKWFPYPKQKETDHAHTQSWQNSLPESEEASQKREFTNT